MTIPSSPARDALFDRLGGFDGLETAVRRCFKRLAADPALAMLLPATGLADVQWQVQLLLTDLLGGPMSYDGPDPAGLRQRCGIDAARAGQLISHLAVSFGESGVREAQIAEVRRVLEEYAVACGAEPRHSPTTGVQTSSPPFCSAGEGRADLVVSALLEATGLGVADRPLFVLDPELTVVHLNADAQRAAQAVDRELRRAFRLGAGDLLGHSILRFHPAPSQLQVLFHDVSRLPHETTWCFGQVVWTAKLFAVRDSDGRLLGYAIAWRDESDSHRAGAVFERLRLQAEDLPVPVMYPDPAIEKWLGNAACEHALERLAPFLPYPVNPLDGVPVGLFLPDEQERRAIFGDPARLPYKSRIKIGPETIAILVSPVLDQDQRYLGPQITWEIVHFTRPEPAPASAPVVAPAPAPSAAAVQGASPAAALRSEAHALEATAAELRALSELLDRVADRAEEQCRPLVAETTAEAAADPAGQAEAAIATALVAVRHAAEAATGRLAAETRAFTSELQHRLRDSLGQARAASEVLGRIVTAAAGLAELRAGLGEPFPQPEEPPAAGQVSAG